MAYPNINYQDGDIAAAAESLSVYIYNNGQTYSSDSGDPSETVVRTETTNSNGQVNGSTNFVNQRVGTINITYDSINDELDGAAKQIRPTYIASFRGRFYILGNTGSPITKGESTTVAAEVAEAQNPIIPELLSVLGQQKALTFADADQPETFDVSAINTRTGASVVFSLENWDEPGAAAPTGFSINSSSGLITITGAAVGVHDIRVIASDTVTPLGEDANTIKGHGRLTVTITA